MADAVFADRVKETSTTTGTVAFALAGALQRFSSFFSAIPNGSKVYYTAENMDGTDWEVGEGTYDSTTNTLSRERILSSSNFGSIVSFAAGTKHIYVIAPKLIFSGLLTRTLPSITEYGAKGDGATYDSAAFEACAADNKGVVFIPPRGTYVINVERTTDTVVIGVPGRSTITYPNNSHAIKFNPGVTDIQTVTGQSSAVDGNGAYVTSIFVEDISVFAAGDVLKIVSDEGMEHGSGLDGETFTIKRIDSGLGAIIAHGWLQKSYPAPARVMKLSKARFEVHGVKFSKLGDADLESDPNPDNVTVNQIDAVLPQITAEIVMSDGGAGSGGTTAPATGVPTAPASVTGASWDAQAVWNLHSTSETGVTPGTTLKVPGVDAAPAGWNFDLVNKRITPSVLGAALSGWDLRDLQIIIGNDNCTISDCLFGWTAAGSLSPRPYIFDFQASGCTVSRCTWDNSEMGGGTPFMNNSGSLNNTVSRCRFLDSAADHMKTRGGSCLFEDCYWTAGGYGNSSAHSDGMQVQGSEGDFTFRRCLGNYSDNANHYGVNNHIRVQQSAGNAGRPNGNVYIDQCIMYGHGNWAGDSKPFGFVSNQDGTEPNIYITDCIFEGTQGQEAPEYVFHTGNVYGLGGWTTTTYYGSGNTIPDGP